MKQIGVLAFLSLVFPASFASATIINDPSALPAVENGNGFISSSTEKAAYFSSSSPVIPENQESDVKFGHRFAGSHKPFQPHHVSPVPERYGPVIPPKVNDFSDQKPLVLKYHPSVLPKEEILIPSFAPVIPSFQVPVVSQQPIIPVTEGQVPVEDQHIPHKSKKHRRPHVPKHQRKHVPHVPKHRCECKIPIIPDDTKPQRRHHVPKHTRKTEKRQHILHHDEDKF